VYYASAPVQAGKAVARMVLPDVTSDVVSGSPSMHVFAVTFQ
jgi:hypothetical protein